MGCCGDKAKKAIHYAKGAAKIGKSVLGVGIADGATIDARRATCRVCDEIDPPKPAAIHNATCKLCGCRLQHKTRLKGEQCPEGKW